MKHVIYFGHAAQSNASRNTNDKYEPKWPHLRLHKQIKEVNLFDTETYYTLSVLESIPEWTHSDFCNKNSRGFGYWIWKPFIINNKLSKVSEGDVVMYCDLGCELLVEEKHILQQLLCSDEHDITLSIPGMNPLCMPYERDWCKTFTAQRLEASDQHLESWQYQATCMIIKNNAKTRQFVTKWLEICEEYKPIDDNHYGKKPCDAFRDHRHDQSVLSLLLKQSDLRISTDVGTGVVMLRNPGKKPLGRWC